MLETRHHPEQMGQMELQGGEAPGGDGFWQARIPASVTPLVRGCPFTWLAPPVSRSAHGGCRWGLHMTGHPHGTPTHSLGSVFVLLFVF